MSYYYKYKFVSPVPLFGLVKEELKSYFDAGIVDDSIFPSWTMKCLAKLGQSSFPVNQVLLNICNRQATLPEDFHAVREAWSCTSHTDSFQLPNARYDTVKSISTRLDNPDLYCNLCRECEIPDIIQVIYKTTNTVFMEFKRTHLMTPGNIYPACPDDLFCANRGSISHQSYDIRDNKISTTFTDGVVYLQYYSTQYDGDDNMLIPDNYEIMEYIEAFIKQKCMEMVSLQVTDQGYNQSMNLVDRYTHAADEKYIIARTETMKEDVYRKQRAQKRILRRNRKYEI